MHGTEKAFIVLADARELRPIFDAWPVEMHLAICLLSDGECHLVVFREEELASILPRLIRDLELDSEKTSVTPPQKGFSTQHLHYSDQRRLMELVSDQPEIVEEAADYSINYTFALEEDLLPEQLLAGRHEVMEVSGELGDELEEAETPVLDIKEDAEPEESTETEGQDSPAVLPGFLRRSNLTVSKLSVAAPCSPGPGFRSARQIADDEKSSEQFEILPELHGLIEIVKPGAEGAEIRFSNPDRIFLRDDRKVIALARETSSLRFQVPPTRFLLEALALPEHVRVLLADSAGKVQVSKSTDFIFIHLPEPRSHEVVEELIVEDVVDDEVPDQPEAIAPVRARQGMSSRMRRSLFATCLFAIGAYVGLTYWEELESLKSVLNLGEAVNQTQVLLSEGSTPPD